MANIQSAKKKVRKDIGRTKRNNVYRSSIDRTMRTIAKTKDTSLLVGLVKKAYSLIDRASKRKVLHRNKASRLKSRVTRLSRTK